MSDPAWTPMQFASMIVPNALIQDGIESGWAEQMMLKNAWAEEQWVKQQVSEGRSVMEHIIDTRVKRMRPLRPDDV